MNSGDPVPLCVDLDGTLLLSDPLIESFCQLLKVAPWTIALVPFWLMRGRAHLISRIVQRVKIDVRSWPFNAEVLDYVRAARNGGRKIVLVAAAGNQIASAIQSHLGLFDEIVTSDGICSLDGRARAALLEQRFGSKNFDYLGNRASDLPVWQAARSAGVAGGENGLVARVKACATVDRVFSAPRRGFKDWASALRIHQWSKNFLLLVPVV